MEEDIIVILGLGYVGLNLAYEMVHAGFKVIGVDSNPEQIQKINNNDVPDDIICKENVQEMFKLGFIASNRIELISEAAYVFICVPTPLGDSGEPDLSAIRSASTSILRHLRLGCTVVLESTSFPGTTEDILVNILESNGLKSESQFYVVFSSERVDPGNKVQNIRNTPKVIAARSTIGMEKALKIYNKIVDEVVPTFKVREAEMSKLIENTYRLINIAFINELARIATSLDIDLMESLRLSATKPFGYQVFWPGAGIGGHCIPVDPVFLQYFINKNTTGDESSILNTAIQSNKKSIQKIVENVTDEIKTDEAYLQGQPLIILGITYKANSSDLRESPSVQIIHSLQNQGVNLRVYDPLADKEIMPNLRINSNLELLTYLSNGCLILLLQAHECMDIEFIRAKSRLILDTSHSLFGLNVKKV